MGKGEQREEIPWREAREKIRIGEIGRRKEVRRKENNKVGDKQAVNIWLHSLTNSPCFTTL